MYSQEILALDKERQNKAGILKLENSMESLTPWMDLRSYTDELWRYGTYSDADRNHAACHAGRSIRCSHRMHRKWMVWMSVIYSDKDTVYLAVVYLTQDAEAGRSIEKPWCKTGARPRYGTRACSSEGGAGTNMKWECKSAF